MARKKKGEGGSQAFAVAQQIGKSLFLPIAVLPPAGILLGIGSSFTNSTTIATYHLDGILHPGSILYMFFQMLNGAGNAVFGNLALIFALAVALGMAKKEKGVAVLSAAIFYLIMLTTMNVLLQIDGSIDQVCSPYPIDEKFKAFGFHVINIDGNDFNDIKKAFDEARATKGQPTAIIAKTVKGKGVSFMENQVGWHGKAPNDEEFEKAMAELDKIGGAI